MRIPLAHIPLELMTHPTDQDSNFLRMTITKHTAIRLASILLIAVQFEAADGTSEIVLQAPDSRHLALIVKP